MAEQITIRVDAPSEAAPSEAAPLVEPSAGAETPLVAEARVLVIMTGTFIFGLRTLSD